VVAQRASGYERVSDDRYETPDAVTATVVPYLRSCGRHLLEPAMAPSDAMGQTLRRAGFRVTSTAGDFPQTHELPASNIDATNPPYGPRGATACSFIEHGLVLTRHVVLLLPIDFDSAKGRTHLFRDCPAFAHKIILLGRVKWFAGPKSPSSNHAWYCFDREHRGPATIGYAVVGRHAGQPRLELNLHGDREGVERHV
jgi:hypothetical protein